MNSVDWHPTPRPGNKQDELAFSLFDMFLAHYDYVGDLVCWEMASDAAKHVMANKWSPP